MSFIRYQIGIVSAWLLLFCSHAFAFHFISLSDIHFEPYAGCAQSKKCLLVKQLRQAPATEWAGILANQHLAFPGLGHDTNYPLLVSAFTVAKKASQEIQPAFVLVLGDFLGHDYRRHYREFSGDLSSAGYQAFVSKTFEFLVYQLAQTFPGVDVYTVTGNNDSFQRDYVTDAHGLFFQQIGSILSRLIVTKENRIAMLKTFPQAGYYAVTLPGKDHVRLIMLNTTLFSYKARGNNISGATNQELAWLHHELSALGPQQKAFIAMHIPTGFDIYGTLRMRLMRLLELWRIEPTKNFKEQITE